jgi:hypothetical protein
MTTVHIKGYVSFSTASFDATVHEKALELPPEELQHYLRLAFEHVGDWPLVEMGRAGRGPLLDYPADLQFEEYLQILEVIHIAEAGHTTKGKLTSARRAEFGRDRAALVLRMIDAGMAYVCSVPGCKVTDGLAVDHILPLSRGGTDDLSNLRFLCASHNSQKGDRVADPWL